MRIPAYAKVNLALDILGSRKDGKHDMDMVNARVSLCDILDIEESDQDEIVCETMKLPAVNTLSKTLEKLREHGLQKHYKIRLLKNIPEKAGLGGGSADAAALLVALNEMEDLQLSLEELEAIGFEIGADVPCCLHTGYTRVSGAGEHVRDLDVKWSIPVIIVQSAHGISTKEAFEAYDLHPERPLDVGIVSDAVRKKDIGLLYQTMTNAFENQAFERHAELGELKEDMQDAGLVRVMMSGSGSALMGFSVDDDVLSEAYEHLKERYPFVWKGTIGL